MLPDWIHTTLTRADWHAARNAHEAAVDRLIGPHLDRRSRHERDPVTDFLFEYYRFRPSALRAWSPGFGVALEDGAGVFPEDLAAQSNDGAVFLAADRFPEKHMAGTRFMLRVLEGTRDRPPLFGCAGMHEWAMVYRAENIRHDQLPLRLSADEIARIVEQGPVACTHYDAFRFFTPEAQPLNRAPLTPADMERIEQPGCLHVNMDLYRWAFKRAPWISSDLILECLELAFAIREVDMRASPYDVSVLGLEPIAVETRAGRTAYAGLQQGFHERAAPLRDRLIDAYQHLCTACFATSGTVS